MITKVSQQPLQITSHNKICFYQKDFLRYILTQLLNKKCILLAVSINLFNVVNNTKIKLNSIAKLKKLLMHNPMIKPFALSLNCMN
jgi:hypothetical protein